MSQAATAAMSATLVYVRVIAASRVLREGAGAGIWVVPTMEAGTSKWRGMCDGGAALKHHRLPASLPPAVARPRGNRYKGGAEVQLLTFPPAR